MPPEQNKAGRREHAHDHEDEPEAFAKRNGNVFFDRRLTVVRDGVLLAADDTNKDAKKDLDKLQGTWLQLRPGTQSDEAKEAPHMTIKGNEYTYAGEMGQEKGTMTLDPSKDPKAIDIKITEGEDKDKTQLGIYEIDGDTFRLCVAQPGSKERPKAFEDSEGESTLFAFKREKK